MPDSLQSFASSYGARLDPEVWDRIVKSLSFEEGDRVPIWEYIDNRPIVDHFAQEGDDYDTAMVRVYHGLGIDVCRGYGSSFASDEEETVTEGEVETIVSGLTRWAVKRPIGSLDDLRSYEPELIDENAVRTDWVDEMRRRQRMFAPRTMYVPSVGLGFHATYGLMGQMLFSYAIYDARAEIDRIMSVLNENSVTHARVCAEEKLSPIYFAGDDIAYKGGLLFSPQFLRETFIPCLRRTVEPLKEAGIKVFFHSDGNVMEILDDMIEAGIDGLHPIEPMAGMDIGLLKRRYGKNLILAGNVDCSQVLPLGSVEEVVAATIDCIRQASPGGGHFIGSSSELVPSTPVENALAFYETCRDYGRFGVSV